MSPGTTLLFSRGHELLDVFGILPSLPWCLGSDDVASDAAPATLDLTGVPLECAVLTMTVTLLGALSCGGPDRGASL